jgi:hypothetical protein
MGQSQSGYLIGYEDVQQGQNDGVTTIINTLSQSSQACLIAGTVEACDEEKVINVLLKKCRDSKIIIYGANSVDVSSEKKKKQLDGLGFTRVFVYTGGLFEWLLLQEVYGMSNFATTAEELDILKFSSRARSSLALVSYSKEGV